MSEFTPKSLEELEGVFVNNKSKPEPPPEPAPDLDWLFRARAAFREKTAAQVEPAPQNEPAPQTENFSKQDFGPQPEAAIHAEPAPESNPASQTETAPQTEPIHAEPPVFKVPFTPSPEPVAKTEEIPQEETALQTEPEIKDEPAPEKEIDTEPAAEPEAVFQPEAAEAEPLPEEKPVFKVPFSDAAAPAVEPEPVSQEKETQAEPEIKAESAPEEESTAEPAVEQDAAAEPEPVAEPEPAPEQKPAVQLEPVPMGQFVPEIRDIPGAESVPAIRPISAAELPNSEYTVFPENKMPSESDVSLSDIDNEDEMSISLLSPEDDESEEGKKKNPGVGKKNLLHRKSRARTMAERIGATLAAFVLLVTVVITSAAAYFVVALNDPARTFYGCHLCPVAVSSQMPLLPSGTLAFVAPCKADEIRNGTAIAYRDRDAGIYRYAYVMNRYTDKLHKNVVLDVAYADKDSKQVDRQITEDDVFGTVKYAVSRAGGALLFLKQYVTVALAIVTAWVLLLIAIIVLLIR